MTHERRALLFAFAGLCALVSRTHTATADCAPARLALGAAIENGTRLPAGAPIVAIQQPHFAPAGPPPARALVGSRRIALRERTIAPDVVALEPTEAPPPGTYRVEGLVAPLSVEYTVAPAPSVSAAPVFIDASHVSLGLDRHAGERSQTRATLGAPVPAGIAVVLVRWIVGGRTVGTSFQRVTPGATAIVLFETAPGCAVNPSGQSAPPPGASAEIAWVDTTGRTGPWSNRRAVSFAHPTP